MLAGLDSRQISEMYAFAELEPLDEPLQKMLAQLTSVLARVHGNEMAQGDFMLVPAPAKAVPVLDETQQRAQQLVDLFSAASRKNEKVH